jgi:hypothetical protein
VLYFVYPVFDLSVTDFGVTIVFVRVKAVVGATERTELVFGTDCHHFVNV